jgi:hypothetical protein
VPKEELVTVLFTLKTLPPAQKELDKMDKDQVQKIYDHIEQLKIDPFRQQIEAKDLGLEGVISEGEETECSDDIWAYYEAHKDELEDLDEYARARGLVKHVIG